MARLERGDVGCWVLKTARPPGELVPAWRPPAAATLTRCVRPTYRLSLMAPGQPCLLWRSGRAEPGVHALGRLLDVPRPDGDGLTVGVRLALLPEAVARVDLLTDPVFRDAEVLRMPAGSNPSWLSRPQFAALLARVQLPDAVRWPATMEG